MYVLVASLARSLQHNNQDPTTPTHRYADGAKEREEAS